MNTNQVSIDFGTSNYDKSDVLKNIKLLISMHKAGKLGGEVMPEDARPNIIDIHSLENYHFLTLPMALNYQRNSYTLWQSAASAYLDKECNAVFNPNIVAEMSVDELRTLLLKHKVALQPNKHIDTWRRISIAIVKLFDGDIRNLFIQTDADISKIKSIIQEANKKDFPYLSGHKIFNYWLHVMEVYTPTKFKNRHEISVAPDTHIIQGTLRLGLITGDIEEIAQNRTVVADAWTELLKTTDIVPIDVHTPLWLWSKRGFPKIE
jgi:hypothetical protein